MSWKEVLKGSISSRIKSRLNDTSKTMIPPDWQDKLQQFVDTKSSEIIQLVSTSTSLSLPDISHWMKVILDSYSSIKALTAWLNIVDSIKQAGQNPSWLLEPESWLLNEELVDSYGKGY